MSITQVHDVLTTIYQRYVHYVSNHMYTMKPRNGELAPIQTRFLHQVETFFWVPKDFTIW